MISHNKPSAGHNQNINSAIPFIASLAPPDHQPLRFCPLGFACYGATSCRREVARARNSFVSFLRTDSHTFYFFGGFTADQICYCFSYLFILRNSALYKNPPEKSMRPTIVKLTPKISHTVPRMQNFLEFSGL